jgi:hypothetical protein
MSSSRVAEWRRLRGGAGQRRPVQPSLGTRKQEDLKVLVVGVSGYAPLASVILDQQRIVVRADPGTPFDRH